MPTGWIAVRKDELTILSLELVRIPDRFIEKCRKTNGEAFRAGAGIAKRRVGNVTLLIVVDAVEVFTIPAAWEHELEANTFGTLLVQEALVWHEVSVEGSFWCSVVIETIESKGPLTKEGLLEVFTRPVGFLDIGNRVAEVSLIGIASEHLESFRKCGQFSIEWFEQVITVTTLINDLLSDDLFSL